MADKGGIGTQQYQIPPPKTQGAATGGQQLSATATQFVDKIDPFSKKQVFLQINWIRWALSYLCKVGNRLKLGIEAWCRNSFSFLYSKRILLKQFFAEEQANVEEDWSIAVDITPTVNLNSLSCHWLRVYCLSVFLRWAWYYFTRNLEF